MKRKDMFLLQLLPIALAAALTAGPALAQAPGGTTGTTTPGTTMCPNARPRCDNLHCIVTPPPCILSITCRQVQSWLGAVLGTRSSEDGPVSWRALTTSGVVATLVRTGDACVPITLGSGTETPPLLCNATLQYPWPASSGPLPPLRGVVVRVCAPTCVTPLCVGCLLGHCCVFR